ncbi:MAG: hypothetical protein JWM99_1297, partial [Verrucomicrobiales bacterium]|nr:hypothetical protein [Verrucomicrobiales bacterium]
AIELMRWRFGKRISGVYTGLSRMSHYQLHEQPAKSDLFAQ